jgi:hypothetical protein
MYDWKFYSKIYVIEKYHETVFMSNLGNVIYYYLQINCTIELLLNNNSSTVNNLCGIKLSFNKINQGTLINILQYYLILNNYFIYKNEIYVKIKNTKISYKLLGPIKEILYDNFQENVIKFFLLNYENYFKGFDFNFLVKTYFINSKNIIESIKDISTQKINPDFSLMEFIDGIYSIKYDRFFPNRDDLFFNNNISTIKFYEKRYSWVRRSKPEN